MGVLIAQLSTCHREKFRCSRSINNYRAIMFYIQKDFDTKIDIHYYRFGIYNKDPGFCKQKAIKVYTATQGTISQRFLNLNLITIFNTYYQRRAFCYRDRHVNKFDLLKCSKRRVIDQISIGQNLNHFYIVKKRSKKKKITHEYSRAQAPIDQWHSISSVFWLTSSKTFHQLQYLVRTTLRKK